MTNLLDLKDVTVQVGNRIILNQIRLSLKEDQTYFLLGPNGSGKTTLINTIMGLSSYSVKSGKIEFIGKDITDKSLEERASLGISMGFQHPPEITGVKLSDLLKICLNKDRELDFNEEERKLIEDFRLTEFLDRDVNVAFSGGERKRSEILQMIFLKPKLILLDEPDSGVDVESLKIISIEIRKYIEKTKSSALIVTHRGEIFDYIKAKYACVLLEGKIHCFTDPMDIYETIKTKGYKECITCQRRTIEGW